MIIENAFMIASLEIGGLQVFNILKRMINSNKYSNEYLEERIEAFYLVGRISTEEYNKLYKILYP